MYKTMVLMRYEQKLVDSEAMHMTHNPASKLVNN